MQDVYGAEQHLDRTAEREVYLIAFDEDVVLPVGIVRIQAKRVSRADVPGIRGAQYAVLPREAEAPLPLLAQNLKFRSLFRDRDEFVPYEQARSQHPRDAHRGQS